MMNAFAFLVLLAYLHNSLENQATYGFCACHSIRNAELISSLENRLVANITDAKIVHLEDKKAAL